MPFPVIPLFAEKPLHPVAPLDRRTAGARSEGQGRPSTGASRAPLTAASTSAGWRRGGAETASHCAVLMLAATLALCAGSNISVAQSASVERPAADPYAVHIAEAARRFAVPEHWIRAVMHAESINDPAALSPKGAIGLMQVMPATWDELRAKHGLGDDPWRPRDNILAGTAYLREMHDRYRTIGGMLAAYNAGPGRYDHHLATGRALPAETVDYVAKIMPMIDGTAAISRSVGRRLSSSWSRAPLFVGRSVVQNEDVPASADLPSGSASEAPAIVDLSALVPPSDGLFVRRAGAEGERR